MKWDFIDLLIWLTIAVQLVAMLTAFSTWLKLRTSALRWMALYVAIEFCRSSIGCIMGNFSINNHKFYLYSGLLTQVSFFLFALVILKDQKRRRFTQWAYGVTLTAFLLLEVFPLPMSVRTIFVFHYIFEIVVGISILNDRIYHHEGIRFNKDPWSIITMVIVLTLSISFICFISFTSLIEMPEPIINVFEITNIISVFVRNSLITNQLWKLRTSTC